MKILKKTSLLSFEITNRCNMQHIHDKCPINCRKYNEKEQSLDKQSVVRTIKMAKELGFSGMVAFHYYNEPLLEKDLILSIMAEVPECKYLLWTNGLLLSRNVKDNEFLKRFTLVCITCYDKADMAFFQEMSDYYKNVEIFDWELDDRLEIYNKNVANPLSCKRPLFEIPIDFYGNIHLCCMDWNNSYIIGNIFREDFTNIMCSQKYQNLIKMCKQRIIDDKICPPICRTCDKMWVSYPRYYDK